MHQLRHLTAVSAMAVVAVAFVVYHVVASGGHVAAAVDPALGFSPASTSAAVATPVPIDITVANVSNLGGYDVWVSFNQAAVQLSSLSDSGFLGTGSNIIVCNTPSIDNVHGSGNLACGTFPFPLVTPGPGVSTVNPTALVHAVFTGVANGSSPLGLAFGVNTSSIQDPFGADITPLSLGSGSLTIGVPATATPTGTPTPTATSTPVPTPTPCGPDANGDGIPDCWEVQYSCLNVASPDANGDPDGDGLTNLQEYLRGTNPCNPDTDGDGYTDGQEVTLGKDPLTYCAIMRADVNDDGKVNLLDLGAMAAWFGQVVPPAPQRLDQNADNRINLLDLGAAAARFGESVLICP